MSRNTRTQGRILIGIDGGGTHTRVLCTDLCGQPLSYAESDGSNPDHNQNGEANVKAAVSEALHKAGSTPIDVAAIVGGLAGYDNPWELQPAAERIRLDGMTAPITVVNDAVVAHAGALGIAPGVLTVAGSGAGTIYIDEERQITRNYDFNHYSHAGGRHLGYSAVFELLTRELADLDKPLLDAAFQVFDVCDLEGLRAFASTARAGDQKKLIRWYGKLAPDVTANAELGSPIAEMVCERAAYEVAQSICIVVPLHIRTQRVKVVLHGGVATCNYFHNIIVRALSTYYPNRFEVVKPILSPVAGAALLAYADAEGKELDSFMNRLKTGGYAGKRGV